MESAFFPGGALPSSSISTTGGSTSPVRLPKPLAIKIGSTGAGPSFRFPASRRYLWDRTAAGSPVLVDCKVIIMTAFFHRYQCQHNAQLGFEEQTYAALSTGLCIADLDADIADHHFGTRRHICRALKWAPPSFISWALPLRTCSPQQSLAARARTP
jgi:hypothetical protein